MVCSCATLSNCVWLWCLAANNILLIHKRTHAFLLAWKWQIALLPKDIHVDQMIKQLLNSVIAKYRDLSLSTMCTDPPPFRKNWRRSTRLWFTVITESCMGIILHKINKKQFLPTKNSVAHVSCHSSSQNVGAHRQLIFIEQLRERERDF